MIILKLKDGTEEWVDAFKKEIIDGITYFNYSVKTKTGKIFNGAYAASEVAGWKDVGERETKQEE